MAHRGDADLLKVFGSQARQQLPVDVVGPKQLRVLPQSKVNEPTVHVHGNPFRARAIRDSISGGQLSGPPIQPTSRWTNSVDRMVTVVQRLTAQRRH